MKKIETSFVCDDCGAPLPDEFIKQNGKCEQYFDLSGYNIASFPVNTDCWTHVKVDLEVNVDYGGTYREICPKCRVKWLKKALSQFEEVLKDGKDD